MTGERVGSAWLEEQLGHALARIEALAREVARTGSALAAREQEVEELRQALASLDGRTRRHEAVQDGVPALRQSLAAIEERLTAEAALRRDQFAAAERGQDREQAAERSLEHAVDDLRGRLERLERAQQAAAERDAHASSVLAGGARVQEQLAERVVALKAQLEAVALAGRRETGDLEQLREALDAARQHFAAVEARTEVLQHDQQRFEDELRALRRVAERDTQLADLVEQQRVLRLRIEEGLAALDQRVASQALAGHVEAEEHALLRVQVAALDRALQSVATRLEAQHQVLLDHFRRVTLTAEEAGRRQAEEIDRQVRAARELLVRLAESADEATREQPL